MITPEEVHQLTLKSFTVLDQKRYVQPKTKLSIRIEEKIFSMEEPFSVFDIAELCKTKVHKVRGVVLRLTNAKKLKRLDIVDRTTGRALWVVV